MGKGIKARGRWAPQRKRRKSEEGLARLNKSCWAMCAQRIGVQSLVVAKNRCEFFDGLPVVLASAGVAIQGDGPRGPRDLETTSLICH